VTSRSRYIRLGIVLAVIVAAFIVAHVTGLEKRITFDAIRSAVHKAGPWGVLLYVVGFVGLELLHVPGLLFFVTGVVIWGPVKGGLLGGATALVSLTVTFAIVRAIGGKPSIPERPAFLKRVFERLQQRPIVTIAILRLVTFMMPTVTYALALSPVSYRQMFVGSAIGLVPAFTIAALFAEKILHRFFG